MDRQSRNAIERHFYSYATSIRHTLDMETEIIESNLTASLDKKGGRSNSKSDPTGDKAIRIISLNSRIASNEKAEWDSIVYSVFDSYKLLRPDIYLIMKSKYIHRMSSKELSKNYAHRHTIESYRKNWLEIAINLAKEKGLI